jgi:hypothetical protein
MNRHENRHEMSDQEARNIGYVHIRPRDKFTNTEASSRLPTMHGTYVGRLYGKLDMVTDLHASFKLRDEKADLTDDVSPFDEAGLARDGRDDAAVANRSSRVLKADATGRQVAHPWKTKQHIQMSATVLLEGY